MNGISLSSTCSPTDALREQENHTYVPPDMLATWLHDELNRSKREIQTNRVLQTELQGIRDNRKVHHRQGDVFFLQPRSKLSEFAGEKMASNQGRVDVLQLEFDTLMEEFSNLSNFQLSRPTSQ